MHDSPNGALYVDLMIAKNRDQTGRAAERREHDEGAIVVHDGLEVIGAFKNHPIKFARKNGRIS